MGMSQGQQGEEDRTSTLLLAPQTAGLRFMLDRRTMKDTRLWAGPEAHSTNEPGIQRARCHARAHISNGRFTIKQKLQNSSGQKRSTFG